jgi:hypothetical protein
VRIKQSLSVGFLSLVCASYQHVPMQSTAQCLDRILAVKQQHFDPKIFDSEFSNDAAAEAKLRALKQVYASLDTRDCNQEYRNFAASMAANMERMEELLVSIRNNPTTEDPRRRPERLLFESYLEGYVNRNAVLAHIIKRKRSRANSSEQRNSPIGSPTDNLGHQNDK